MTLLLTVTNRGIGHTDVGIGLSEFHCGKANCQRKALCTRRLASEVHCRIPVQMAQGSAAPPRATCLPGRRVLASTGMAVGQSALQGYHDNYINSFCFSLLWRQRKCTSDGDLGCGYVCVCKMSIPSISYSQALLPRSLHVC